MTQYWNNTTAALQPTCRGRRRGGPSGASRGPCLPASLSGVTNRIAVQPTFSLSYFCIIPLEIYSVVFPLSLILHHLMLWNKFASLIIHPSIYHLFIFLSIHPPTHPTIHLPTYLFIHLLTHPPTRHPLPTHPSIHLPSMHPPINYLSASIIFHLSVHAQTHLSISPFIYYPRTRHPLPTHTPRHLSIHSFIHLSINLLIHPTTNIPPPMIYPIFLTLSIYPST